MEDLNGVSKKWPSGVKNWQILTFTREKVDRKIFSLNRDGMKLTVNLKWPNLKAITSLRPSECKGRIDFVFILDELIDRLRTTHKDIPTIKIVKFV